MERIRLASLLLLGLAVQLPWLAAPFGFFELNAGYFFGPFAQSFERFGFGALRGIPLGAYEFLPADPASGYPYFNHPPGSAWLMAALGTSEWHIRLPTAAAVIACGVLLYLLLRPRLGCWPALAAGGLAQVVPVLAFGSLLTYESLVMAPGLLLWLAFERVQAGRRRWRPVLWACALIGPWFEWSFGLFVLGLLPLGFTTGERRLVKTLAAPWLLALASAGVVVLWTAWAKSAPFLDEGLSRGEPVASMLDRTVLSWPPIGVFLEKLSDRLRDGFTLPVLSAAALDTFWLARTDKRLMLAMLVPGVLNVVLFPNHSSTHLTYSSYLVPVVVASVASLLQAGRRLPGARIALPVAFVVLAALPLISTSRYRESSALPVFADLGRTLSALAEEESTDPAGRENAVVTNALQNYPYYVSSFRVYLFPVRDPQAIERVRSGSTRLRYVYLETEIYVRGERTMSTGSPTLLDYLERFPKKALPELIGEWPLGPVAKAAVRNAWVFDL